MPRLSDLPYLAAAAGLLLAGLPLPSAAQVKVKVVATGDVGQYAGMCGASGGTDVLQGVLEVDNLDSDGSARYKGVLTRETSHQACGLKPSPTEDQPTWCTASLDGSAKMAVTLEIYADDRGAWLKSEPVATLSKKISGCTEPGEWLDAFPKDGGMSGLGFDDVPSGLLTVGAKYGVPELTLEVMP